METAREVVLHACTQIFKGKIVEIEWQARVKEQGEPGEKIPCPKCGGDGRLPPGDGYGQNLPIRCHGCNGTGKITR